MTVEERQKIVDQLKGLVYKTIPFKIGDMVYCIKNWKTNKYITHTNSKVTKRPLMINTLEVTLTNQHFDIWMRVGKTREMYNIGQLWYKRENALTWDAYLAKYNGVHPEDYSLLRGADLRGEIIPLERLNSIITDLF